MTIFDPGSRPGHAGCDAGGRLIAGDVIAEVRSQRAAESSMISHHQKQRWGASRQE